MDLVLASTSPYRRELLARLTPNFRCLAPQVAEDPLPNEFTHDLARRLSFDKARDVARRHPGTVVIGADQVANVKGSFFSPLGKPGTVERARAQLIACSGQQVDFHTSVCVVDARAGGDPRAFAHHLQHDTTTVHFRALERELIERYIAREQPLDCAGSFQCEGLGIALFERIESDDPTALIGLPLIALCRLLRTLEIEVP
ncbi:MAG: septum formation protein Maf [Proteobacteria bacterium]|nr:septum formation protein Maf [Pseudomonadota bacterium]